MQSPSTAPANPVSQGHLSASTEGWQGTGVCCGGTCILWNFLRSRGSDSPAAPRDTSIFLPQAKYSGSCILVPAFPGSCILGFPTVVSCSHGVQIYCYFPIFTIPLWPHFAPQLLPYVFAPFDSKTVQMVALHLPCPSHMLPRPLQRLSTLTATALQFLPPNECLASPMAASSASAPQPLLLLVCLGLQALAYHLSPLAPPHSLLSLGSKDCPGQSRPQPPTPAQAGN